MLRSNLLLLRSPLLWKRSIVTVAHSPNYGKGLLLLSRPPHRLWAVTLNKPQQTCRRALAASPDNNNNDGAATKKEPPSSDKAKTAEETAADNNNKTAGGEDSKEIVLTPGETVVAVTRLGMWGGIFAFACVCGYFIVKELLPTKMSPNRIFDKSFDVLRADDAIQQKYGAGIKAYGRDHGGHREGRRNFIEHKEYVDEMTGDKRVRVRYNIEGPYGKAFVFAEVSASMSANEFVYILVQDKADGRTQTIVDNRAALVAQHMAGGNEQASSVISQLLRGGGGSSPKN